jgi:hypothetical protein
LFRQLELLTSTKTGVVVVCEADGKTQLKAIMSMVCRLETELGHPLSHYADLIIGLSAGTYAAYGLSLGIPQSELLRRFPDIPSRLTVPANIGFCCTATRRLKDLANAYTTGKIPYASDKSLENMYDAFEDPAELITTLGDVRTRDPIIPLIDCTSSQSTDPVERIIFSMMERDVAAKYSFARLCWANIIDFTQIALDIAVMAGVDRADYGITRGTADLARLTTSETRTVSEPPSRQGDSSDERHSSVILRFNADTTNDSTTSIYPALTSNPHSLEASFTFKVPLISYPSKELPFRVVEQWIADRVDEAFSNEQTEIRQMVSALARFLNEKWRLTHT